MAKYRRIEVNAYRRRVTIVSGEWPAISPDTLDSYPAQIEESVAVEDSDSVEPIEPDSPEGQEILVEAVRSLERRLSPEALETMRSGRTISVAGGTVQKHFFLWLHPLSRLFTGFASAWANRDFAPSSKRNQPQ